METAPKIIQKDSQYAITKEQKDEVYNLWLANRDDMSLKDIYCELLTDYFPDEWQNNNRQWLFFLRLVGNWRKTESLDRMKFDMENMTDEEAEELQNQNRRRIIVMLREALNKYERNPNFLKKLDVKGVTTLYKIVQSAEEAMKRTELQKGKLKLEAARTFLLPYQRMSQEELLSLKVALTTSIDGIIADTTRELDDGAGPSDVSGS